MSTMINWTPAKLERFREVYSKAAATPDVPFTFEGHQFIVGYAKFLIQYLDMEWERQIALPQEQTNG
jgi:hypothetical protein